MNSSGWILIGALMLATFSAISACRSQEQLPLPSSAKTSQGQVAIPFPYREDGEAWALGRDRSGNMVLEVRNKNQTVATFALAEQIGPLYADKLGTQYLAGYRYDTSGSIQLGDTVYAVAEIDLNTDNQSGHVILAAQ